MASQMPQSLRQAWALSYAMRARPTPELASRYFEALKRLLDTPPKPGTPA
jgi:hypothetical protein